MNQPRRWISRGALLAALVGTLPSLGCAAFSKSTPLEIRYFTPEIESPGAYLSQPPAGAPTLSLRLGRVVGGPELGEEMAWRDSPLEVGFYDNSRWTERPEAYVSRALDRALFGSGRLRHVLAGPAPVLDVRVLAFEEIRPQSGGSPRRARVALAVLLHDDRTALLERRFAQEVVVEGGKVEQFVQGLSLAMQQVVEQVTEQVGATLARLPPTAN
jgi:ABC-type uncharacterized transport system auxiliary subunit